MSIAQTLAARMVQGTSEDDDDEASCVHCDVQTRPIYCKGCSKCRKFMCVDCVVADVVIPTCLENFDEAVEQAEAKIPLFLESLKQDPAIQAVHLPPEFDDYPPDFVTWCKDALGKWENAQHVKPVRKATKCNGKAYFGNRCDFDGPGIYYQDYLRPPETQCLSCLIKGSMLFGYSHPTRSEIVRDIVEVEFRGGRSWP